MTSLRGRRVARDSTLAAITTALSEMEPAELAGMVAYFNEFFTLPAETRAIHIKLLKPTLTDRRIASMVGVNPTTPYAWPAYMRLKQALKILPALPHGTVDEDGFIESYLTSPD